MRYTIQGRIPGTNPPLWEDTDHGNNDFLKAHDAMTDLEPSDLGYTALRISA